MKFIYLLTLLIYAATSYSLSPLETSKKSDFLLRADQISHDKELGVVIARGRVKVSDGQEIIEADTVSYNEKLRLVSASGNVKFYDKKGGLTTANYMEIGEDLKDGFIEKAYSITQENERFASEKVTKNDKVLTFKKGIYSPCEMCEGTSCKTPIWQLRADQIKKDDEEKMVYYRHVFLDFKGVPVFYLPYLDHPDPSVKRKNGLLMPFVGNSTSLGAIVGIPYYFSREPNEEIILKPVIMTKDSPMISGSYGRYFHDGFASFSASTIHTSNITGSKDSEKKNKKQMHGHFIGTGLLDINENWRANLHLENVSSPTYFKKYYFVSDESYRTKNYLSSHFNTEGFYGRNYVSLGGVDFQNLNANVHNNTIPFVAPMVTASYETSAGEWGEFWNFDADQAYVHREKGAKTERLSTIATFTLPHTFSSGLLQELQLFLRGDYYDIRKHTLSSAQPAVNQSRGRVIPGAVMTFRYPLLKTFEEQKLVFEPILSLVSLPRNTNSDKYPNEDSQDFELDSLYIFKPQRFAGFDRIDDGQRINYGANMNLYSQSRSFAQVFLGQSYSFSKTDQFDPYSGVQKGLSDYVGRVSFSTSDLYSLIWSFRFGQKSLKPKKNAVQFSGGPSIFKVNIGYTQIQRTLIDNKYVRREQLSTGLSSQFHPNWTVCVNQAREFGYQKGELQHGAGIIYEDDCFKARLDLVRTFYRDRDVVPSKTIMLTLGFKNLGEYSTGALSLNKDAGVVSSPLAPQP
ncbi:MAG: LPS-assembly protein LptD [Alphaproteobacteria bacterium]